MITDAVVRAEVGRAVKAVSGKDHRALLKRGDSGDIEYVSVC